MALPSWRTSSGSSRERICAASSSLNSISRTAAAALPFSAAGVAEAASGIVLLPLLEQVAHDQRGPIRVLLHEIADQIGALAIVRRRGDHVERDRSPLARMLGGMARQFAGN